MGMMWMHLLHVVRGVIGGLVLLRMPNTHDLLKEVKIDDNKKIPIDLVDEYATIGASMIY